MNARLSMGNVHLRCVQAENHKAKHAIRLTKNNVETDGRGHKKAEQEQKLEGKNLAFGRKQKNRSRRSPNWPPTYPGRGSRSILKTPTSFLCVTRTG